MSEAAVPVAVHGFTWTSALMALANLLIGGLLVSIVRTRPAIMKIANEREAAKAAGRRDEMDDMRTRIGELERKVDVATHAAHEAEMRLVHAVAAVQLLAAKIRSGDPNDPTLKQAMELLAAATAGGITGWAKKLADGIDKVKGVGE